MLKISGTASAIRHCEEVGNYSRISILMNDEAISFLFATLGLPRGDNDSYKF